MKTLIYKIRLGRYELTDLSDNGGDEIKFIFEIPADMKLVICDKVYSVYDGISVIKLSSLPEGDIYPKLYRDGGIENLEGFNINGGAVIRLPRGEEYMRLLSEVCEQLTERTAALEADMRAVLEKISAPLDF